MSVKKDDFTKNKRGVSNKEFLSIVIGSLLRKENQECDERGERKKKEKKEERCVGCWK